MKVASFFAGIGGIDLGFIQAGFEVVYANEIDKYAVQTYEANFDIKVDNRDIKEVEELPDFDIMVGGFPCQPFSVAYKQLGFAEKRGKLFFELERLFLKYKPKIVFFENVNRLERHDNGNTLKVILDSLENAGYNVKYKVLNAKDFNVPQNRPRIFIVGFQDVSMYNRFEFPSKIKLIKSIADCLEGVAEEKYYYRENRKFYDKLLPMKEGSIYQFRRSYLRENKNNVCPCLPASMGTGGNHTPLVRDENGIRKLTPRECFNFQGYPKTYKFPNLANCHLYKQIGNSVAVPVIKSVAEQIRGVL